MTRRPWAAALAALLGPALVAGWAFGELYRPPVVSGKAAAFEARVDRAQPEVVVLGSSLAQTNVRLDLLAEALDVPRERVVMLTLPNATAAHWYAILNNRLLRRGHRPKLVVVVGALSTFITPDLLKDTNVERLINQLDPDEPVLGPKVFGTTSPTQFRFLFLRERAGASRDALLNGWRDRALGLVFARGRAAAGARLAERANEVVFPPEALDFELHRSRATGLGVQATEALSLEGLDVARDSLIPDLGELARVHGVRLVWVRTPFPPSNQGMDAVPEPVAGEAVVAIANSGAEWIDLRGLGVEEAEFQDMRHMNREGATRFTRALADALGGEAALGRARVHERPRVLGIEVVGEVGGDAPEGLRGGEGAALGPGQTLRVEVERPWPAAPEDFLVWFRGEGAGEARLTVATPEASVDWQGALVDAALDLPAPRAATWTLSITAAPDSAWVRLTELGFGRPPHAVSALGTVDALSGASVRIIGGRTDDTGLTARFAHPPPALEASGSARPGPRARGAAAADLWVLPAEPFAALADASHVHAAWPQQCSPLRVVLSDGRYLSPWARQDELKGQAGAVLHAGGALYFSGPAQGDPASARLVLDPERACRGIEVPGGTPLRGALWLYPGDLAEIDLPTRGREGLRGAASELELEVELLGEDAGWLEAELWLGESAVASLRIEGTPGALRRRSVALPAPLRAGEAATLRLRRDDSRGAWWRVRRAALTEPAAAALRTMQGRGAEAVVRVPPSREGLEHTARRVGAPPEPPVVAQTAGDGVQRWRVPDWWMVSDAALAKEVGQQASPVGVRDDEGWLSPVSRARFEGCVRCRAHVGAMVFARASGPALLGLDDRLPVPVAEGSPRWWLWPGTSLRFTPRWPEGGGAVTVYARVRSFEGRRGVGQPPALRLGDHEVSLRSAASGVWEGSVEAAMGEVSLYLHPDAPFAWVETLRVQTPAGPRSLVEALP